MYMFVCQEFLSNLRPELAQWKIVLKHLPIMLEMEHKLFEICRAHAKEMAEDDVIQFCSAIAKHIYHCRKFPNASKGESPEIVAQLETLYNEILPKCPKAFLHNFDWQYEGLNPIPFQEIKYVREQEEACELEDCKKQMARMISINGKDAFLTIASKTENQKKFAQVFISMYMNNVFDWKAVERVRVQSESCARRVVQELSYEGLFSVNPSQIEQLEPMDAIWILSCFDITEKNIVILESYPDEVQKKYWEMVNCSWMDYNDIKMVRHILPRIAEAKRCYQILNHFAYGENSDILSIVFLLNAVNDEYASSSIRQYVQNSINSETIDRLFDKMYTSSEGYENSIAELELKYLRVRENPSKFLLEEIMKNPKMFVDLLALVYRKDDAANEKIDDEVISKARFYRDFLNQVKQLPGTDLETKQINPLLFRDWLQTVFQLAEKRSYKMECDYEIGRLLSWSPIGNDGLWPAECVRGYLEECGNDTVLEAMKTARYNQRGIYSASAGANERELSLRYEGYAVRMEVLYPHTAQMLYDLAKIYAWDSRRESQRELIGY